MADQDNQANQSQFSIQRIYCKDISLETPNSPLIFQEQWQPQADLEIDTVSTDLGGGVWEVTLTITSTVKVGEKTAFLIEVNQSGVFTINGMPDQQMGQMLGSFCPNILFPYAREAISDITNRGGFPPLVLSPVNFDAIYAQRLQQQAHAEAQAQAQAQAAPTVQ